MRVAASGGGHEIWSVLIAAEHAIFGQNGPRVGSPASGPIVSFSARILGHKRAREMWMLCRRYTAREMLEWGLVNAVVPGDQLDAEVQKWCDELLALSPTCLRILKASFVAEWEYALGLEDALRRHILKAEFFQTEQREGARAFLEKRRPDFWQFRRPAGAQA